MTTTEISTITIATLRDKAYMSPSVRGRYVVTIPGTTWNVPSARFTTATLTDYVRAHGANIYVKLADVYDERDEGRVCMFRVAAYDDPADALAVARAYGARCVFDTTLGENVLI